MAWKQPARHHNRTYRKLWPGLTARGAPQRCPGCGGLVHVLPCPLCQARQFVQLASGRYQGEGMIEESDLVRLATELNNHRPVTLELVPQSVLCLIAQLQLALRHPGNRGESARWARACVDQLIDGLEISAGARALLRRGDDPRHDVTIPWTKSRD